MMNEHIVYTRRVKIKSKKGKTPALSANNLKILKLK